LKTEFKKSFLKDVKALRDAGLKERIKDVIAQVGTADAIRGVSSIKKLTGSDRYYPSGSVTTASASSSKGTQSPLSDASTGGRFIAIYRSSLSRSPLELVYEDQDKEV
jgi:hypothetical protein